MPNIHNYFVYILECTDGSYYVGVTNDLERRLEEHNSGYNPTAYTFNRRPVILRYYQRFTFIEQAIAFEKQLKGWNRKKKEALFNEDWNEIKRLSNLKKK
ncbi:GIY-YIG nuclease family protein [Pedobacter montanisoli]|uniref:GIY-YIG nuclease family protein n=1 Tax=Pedobacter montanisoli TaxID=2923277 RepID=A0ABS9ZWI4_9SPHI|nr:GIY-YIG nuclease family protein [Pedobacter montanisoli]MCJ0742675.1 GIY-YIG nuclease family protein [Pedobacter montanisoli]